jgi:hypothetical protein
MFVSQWFITQFTYDFPIEFLVRLWDVYLAEGVKIIFRFAIALLKREEGSFACFSCCSSISSFLCLFHS